MHMRKGIIICCLTTVMAAIGALSFGIYHAKSSEQVFESSGYILVSPDSSYSDQINTQIYFEKGTKYKKVYPDKIVFKSQDGVKRVVDAASFVHYNDGSLGSLSQGVMVDLNNLNDSLISYYGLSTASTMSSTGSDFMLDNQGSSMSFQDFIWKIDDTKYLLVGDNIQIDFSAENQRVFRDFVEVCYYDTGIIRIVTREGTWETVSAYCYATLDNGVKLNLSNKTVIDDGSTVKLSLEQMVIDSDENIEIVPKEVKEEVIKAPEFDIQTIDGTAGTGGAEGKSGDAGKKGVDGTEGEEGKAGENGENGLIGADGIAGDPGEPGITGITGVSGNNGVNGANGANGAAGANGAQGEKGTSGDELANNLQPGKTEKTTNIVMPAFTINSLNVTATGVKASIAVTDPENRLNPSEPFKIQLVENNTGKLAHQATVDPSNRTIDFEYNGLLPSTEYRLALSATYVVDNVDYQAFFINKLFSTNALGITVTKNQVTQTTMSFLVNVSGYTQLESADLQLTDAAGNPKGTIAILPDSTKAQTIEFTNLDPNTEYKVKVVNIKMNYDANLTTSPVVQDQTFWTLKRIPTLGTPIVVLNKRNGCFEVKLNSVTDLDKAILKYRYEFYQVAYDDSQTLAKTLYNISNDTVSCYVDGVDIKPNYNYRVRVVAEGYDNEKNVEYSSIYSDIVSLTGNNFPIVLFNKKEDQTHHDRLSGDIIINTNGAKLSVNSGNPLTIEYKSTTGDVETITLEEISAYSMSGSNGVTYTIPFNNQNLKAADNYVISVWGTVDLNDGLGNRFMLIGNVVTKTDTPASLRAIFTQDSTTTSAVSFNLSLVGADYEASTMEYLEIFLYNGDESAVGRFQPIGRYVLQGVNGENYNSSLQDVVYGTNKLSLTAADFNISPSSITSKKYTIEVSSIRDYTKYANEFTVKNNIITFDKVPTLPDIATVVNAGGLIVTPITLNNISQYVDESAISQYTKYNPNIILGYEVSAAGFDNSANLVDSFTYYAFEESNYTTWPTAAEFYTKNTAAASKTETVVGDGTVPKAVFLIKPDGTMTRGTKYIFTFRAKLKAPDINGDPQYFPESIDSKVVIRSTTKNAPYQTPQIVFYPYVTDVSTATWEYLIVAPDEEAIASNFAVSILNPTTNARRNVTLGNANLSGNRTTLTVSGLNRGEIYTATLRTRAYKPAYNADVTNTLFSAVFESTYEQTTNTTELSYGIAEDTPHNRYIITVKDGSTGTTLLPRVTALKVEVAENAGMSAGKQTFYIPLSTVAGNIGEAYLQYSQISNLFHKNIYIQVSVIYDIGISGFKDATAGSERAIQTWPAGSLGNYITLNYTNNGFIKDETGVARNSYFKIASMTQSGANMVVKVNSGLATYSSDLNLMCGPTGANLQSFIGQPNITLKKLEHLILPITGDLSKATVSTFMFDEMTPTITLNNGAAYTIDTTINSASVHWILQGHEPLLESSPSHTYQFYMELFTVNGTFMTSTGRIFETVVDSNTNYTTNITGLEPKTKYAIQIYYYDTLGHKVYPIDTYRADVEPSSIYYIFWTTDSIEVRATANPVTYVARSYNEKYIRISYTLSQTMGYQIVYSLVKKQGDGSYKVVLDANQLSSRNIIDTPAVNMTDMIDDLMMIPGLVYWTEGANMVYFPFNSNDYYLCITPVSLTNASVPLGDPLYLSLNIPKPSTPFYNINTVPDIGKVTFQISIVDLQKVIVNGRYKIQVLNSAGVDITPDTAESPRDKLYYVSTPASITVDIDKDDYAVLKLYTVYDMLNTGRQSDGVTPIEDINNIAYGDLASSPHLKISTTGYSLGDKGYDLGQVQISQSSSERARLYFTNAVNLSKISYISYVIINEAGFSSSYNEEYFNPYSAGSSGSGSYYYELSHRFTQNGIYQVQVRFYDSDNNKLDDKALIYYKTY